MNEWYMSGMYNGHNYFPQCMQIPVMPVSPKLAHAYVPFQYINCLYPPMQGLNCGTIFPELSRPYGVDPEYTVDA